MAKKLRKTEFCSNCERTLSDDNYCPECGQQNTTNNVDMGMLVKDFVDDFFTLDSRLFKTIIPLLFKPGFLTLQYNQGRRVKYLPPLRMYLVLSVLVFLIPSNDDLSQNDFEINLGEDIELQNSQDKKLKVAGSDVEIDFSLFKTDDAYKDSVIHSMWAGGQDHWLLSLMGERNSKNLLGNSMRLVVHEETRNAFASSYVSKIPKMMFVLLPFFALMISLFFRRKHMLYVQSLIFSLHVHSFFFFVLCGKILLGMAFNIPEIVVLLLIVVLPFLYFVLALRKVYQHSWAGVIIKGSVALGLYGVLILGGLVMVALIMLIFY
jgi:hypothetical protein